MGNTFASKPTHYSDETKINQQQMFDGGYEAAYRQNSQDADSMQYGNTRMQFGVKMLEDVDPGPNQGEMYVNTIAGKRLYFTHNKQLRGDASYIISQGKNYGNGPAVSITGSPLDPQYHMFYSPGGDLHKTNEWQSFKINSKQDVMTAVRSGMQGNDISSGQYSNMYGSASINPFGAKEGSDIWTGAAAFGRGLEGVVSQLLIPVGEMALDTVVPFSSQILGVTGINKALQGGIDSLVKATQGQPDQSAAVFDPEMSNIIKDPRLGGFLIQQENQSQAFTQKYGPSQYVQTNKLAQGTKSQQLIKAKLLFAENQNNWVTGQVQEMTDTSTQLEKLVGSKYSGPVFQQIKTGLAMATNNQQKLNVIAHFSKIMKSDLLPLLNIQHPAGAQSPTSGAPDPQKNASLTASAQPGHPVLSINGTDTSHPGNTTIRGTPGQPPPVVPPV